MSKGASTQDVMDFFDSLSKEDQKRCFLTASEISKRSPNAVIDEDYVSQLKAEGFKAWP